MVKYHKILPPYVQGETDDKGALVPADALRWYGKVPPPAIGTEVDCAVNGIFPVMVDGYFEEEGYLGLHCHHTTEVQHFGRTIPVGAETHLFGPEFRMRPL